MKFGIAVFGRFCCPAFLGVEVVPPGLTRQNLATLGDLEALGVRLVGFHRHNGSTYYLFLASCLVQALSMIAVMPLGLFFAGSATL